MLNNCLIIDHVRWNEYKKQDKVASMILFLDYVIIKNGSTFQFVKNRHDCLTGIHIPNEYFEAIMEYYSNKTKNQQTIKTFA